MAAATSKSANPIWTGAGIRLHRPIWDGAIDFTVYRLLRAAGYNRNRGDPRRSIPALVALRAWDSSGAIDQHVSGGLEILAAAIWRRGDGGGSLGIGAHAA